MPAFLLPDLGEGLTEAEIVGWRVQVGDTVAVDQAVVEVETAKAVVEVPVPFAGQVTELHGKPGDVLAVGDPLITVADEEHSGSVLIGYGTSAGRRGRRARAAGDLAQAAGTPAEAAGTPAQAAGALAEAAGTPAQAPGAGERVAVISPVVRRLARDAGLELTAVRGSGPDGLITRRDVDAAIAARARPETAATRIPLHGARKAMADKLTRSRREIPEATVWVDADATGLLEARAALNAGEAEPAISLLALLARIAILGLARFPELNARVSGDEIVLSPAVHLGFAAQTPRGLMVPVIPDAQAATLEQLSAALAERTQRARDGKLAPGELAGGTFTVNNYGVFGVDGSAAIINHPEVAILGIGRIIERPWVVRGRVVPRHVTELTLAFDHRVCDGATAGGFLRFVADCVEAPLTALRHL